MCLFPHPIARQRPRRSESNEPIRASTRKEVADDDKKNADADWKHSLQVDWITQRGAEHDEVETKQKEHQRDHDAFESPAKLGIVSAARVYHRKKSEEHPHPNQKERDHRNSPETVTPSVRMSLNIPVRRNGRRRSWIGDGRGNYRGGDDKEGNPLTHLISAGEAT